MPDPSHAPPVVFRRMNRALVVVVPLWIVGRELPTSEPSTVLPIAMVFAIGLTCALLFSEWLVLRSFARLGGGRDPRGLERWVPALPFREHASRSRRPWLVMGVVALAVVGARDHAFGDTLSITYEHFHADTQSDRDVGASTRTESFEGEPPLFAERETFCTSLCSPRGPLCDAALREVVCGRGEPGAVQIHLNITMTGSDCSLMPWFHDGRTEYTASGSIEVRDHGTKFLSFHITGHVERHATGFHSCAAFDAAIGQAVGSDVVEAINGMLDDD